jgi:Ase1/PRC1/MAP65 family protein
LNKHETSLRAKVANASLSLEKLKVKKEGRARKFIEIRSQIEQIRAEISGSSCQSDILAEKEDHDLSLRRLEEFQAQLNYLQREKVSIF